jgi:hypothetical protein
MQHIFHYFENNHELGLLTNNSVVSKFRSFSSTSKAEITMNIISDKLGPASTGFLLAPLLNPED